MANWTEREDTVLKAGYEENRPVSEIAQALGRTAGAVRGCASALGISKVAAAETITYIDQEPCPFCGQISLTGDECDCPEAKRERKIKNQIFRAKSTIREVFGEECKAEGYEPVSEDNIVFMNNAAEQIAKYKMHAVAVVLTGGTRAKLTRGAKGVIKVERSETKKTTFEVEE